MSAEQLTVIVISLEGELSPRLHCCFFGQFLHLPSLSLISNYLNLLLEHREGLGG